MNSHWERTALSNVLTKSDRWIILDAQTEYKEVTVRLWGRGVALRGIVSGPEIAGNRRMQVRAGEFIASRIDARNGAFGLIPDELDGAVVTNDFPIFAVDAQRMLPGYLHWLSKTGDFIESCKAASEGTTNRVRLKEDRFLQIEIPLPPLTEQRRIVAKIERLAGKIEEARGLRRQIALRQQQLLRAVFYSGDNDEVPMRDLVHLKEPNVDVLPTEQYQFAGVFSFGRGMFPGEVKPGMEISYKRLNRLQAGQFVYPKLMAWEGAFAIVPPHCAGMVVSTEFPVFDADHDRVLPEVLEVHFTNPAVWQQVSGSSTGTNVRRRRLHPDTLLGYRFPLPSMNRQQQIAVLQGRMRLLESVQAQMATELDALLPAILDRSYKGKL
jgi:type I restriction enzyme S subunit